ncbi:hypothetical protein [Litoribacter populi]|uniref:hypothetical protein n=1 Tax=Litoribacter populi TaxID=2598460 RepID=UPI00117FFD46|nr:hypothetical protein [Litoribacter populi]
MLTTDSKPLPPVFENEILPLLFKEASTVIKEVFPESFEGSPYYPMLLRKIKKFQVLFRARNIAHIKFLKKTYSTSLAELLIKDLTLGQKGKEMEDFYLEEIMSDILPSPYFLLVESISDIFLTLELTYKQQPLNFDGVITIPNKIHQTAFQQKLIMKNIANKNLDSFFPLPDFTLGTQTRMKLELLEVLALPMDSWRFNQKQLVYYAADIKKSIKKINRLNKALLKHYDPNRAISGIKNEKETKLRKRIEEEVEELEATIMFFNLSVKEPCSTLMAFKKHYGNWPTGFPYSLTDFGVDLGECDW